MQSFGQFIRLALFFVISNSAFVIMILSELQKRKV